VTAVREEPFAFTCRSDALVGVVHHGAPAAACGVLIVVGGPQYRVGSHRQFVLLARTLAAAGVPVMRFDYRGMGDSAGAFLGFEQIEDDIAAAIDAFQARCPRVSDIVIWGLCDAASAGLFYAHSDPRIGGLVLVNPWVRTSAGGAKTYLKHYYAARLLDGAFWRKVASGQFKLGASLRSLARFAAKATQRSSTAAAPTGRQRLGSEASIPLPQRMAEGLRRFQGPVLLIMSGNDFTAREFDDVVAASPLWRELLTPPRVTRRDLPAADHTFSRRVWRDQVAAWTLEWLAMSNSGDAAAPISPNTKNRVAYNGLTDQCADDPRRNLG
jgi:exosortase A-associated hydrolase 1